MCSIFGAMGPFDRGVRGWEEIGALATDRGRDGARERGYRLDSGWAMLGSRRAAPTTEVRSPALQPYDGVVHNGTIANDKELGARHGEVDSMVLPRILDRSCLRDFAASLGQIKGSYAMAAVAQDTIFLACNYKPLHFYRDGEVTYFASMERHLAPVVRPGHRAAQVRPYTAMDLRTLETISLRPEPNRRALVVASAGLDSTVAACLLKEQGYDVSLLHFQYGCKAGGRELDRIKKIADALGAPLHVRAMDYGNMQSGGLFDGRLSQGASGAEYAYEWVPARNLHMIAVAVAFAEANDFGAVAFGGNLEEAGTHPDNEEQFAHLLDGVLDYAVADGKQVRLLAPVGRLMKHEIVSEGIRIGAPLGLTWSCYDDGEEPCGKCASCFLRDEAFRRASQTANFVKHSA